MGEGSLQLFEGRGFEVICVNINFGAVSRHVRKNPEYVLLL